MEIVIFISNEGLLYGENMIKHQTAAVFPLLQFALKS